MTSYLSTPPPPPSPRDGGIWDRRTGRARSLTRPVAQRRAEIHAWIRKMGRYGISGECAIAERIDSLEVELAQLRPGPIPPRPSHPWLGQWVIVRRPNILSHYVAILNSADDDAATVGVWMGPQLVSVRLELSLVVGLVVGSRWLVQGKFGEFEVVEIAETVEKPAKLLELKLRPAESPDSEDRITRDLRSVVHFGAFVAGGGA